MICLMTPTEKNLVPNTTNHTTTWPSDYSAPKMTRKEKTTVTKEFNDKGKVVKEITVTEIETLTESSYAPKYPMTYPVIWSGGGSTTTNFVK